jgi:hypothetical protein
LDLLSHDLRCDNESIVHTTNKVTAHSRIFPNATMALEWDVVAEIRASTIQLAAAMPTPKWIKGHQGDNRYEELFHTKLICTSTARV